MHFGLFEINTGLCSKPESVARVACAVEMDVYFGPALRYADLSVDRVTLLLSSSTEGEIIRSIEVQGETIVRKLA